ncbi:IspD/TarI family cytidylyltransferase [Cerasicoccus arenae]|uniref:2-C-methyl-D-erythritol 4-phosphate cytidylyltransferase n=1 Tax=Cerasicoccus arenae TaxID=424488 RepID=A0A8J3GCQ6_9BACT|nr:IspD/TarI family cytidylyltransferase [Cerasicoccus arenae]MBK1857563.1 2-C-methyl-D-erythritol 4-phosphate cytidylyltransferase [Cerasicoccus arenae]GHB95770.1 2-C-methyl-D-erythritol 4-phosphate cytidylyltransferase [Cerasicoccus arenae]
MANAAIFLCAGSGTRMRGQVADKVLTPLGGHSVFWHSIKAFEDSGLIEHAVVVYRDDEQREALEKVITETNVDWEISWALGGKERQDSVFNGLSETSLLVDYVFIHDCARPMIRIENLHALHQAALENGAAVLAHRVADTIKRAAGSQRKLTARKLKDVPRSNLWAMETPQVFHRETVMECYRRLRLAGLSVTDDTAAVAREGHSVTLVENPFPNPKLTTPADLPYLEFLLQQYAQ